MFILVFCLYVIFMEYCWLFLGYYMRDGWVKLLKNYNETVVDLIFEMLEYNYQKKQNLHTENILFYFFVDKAHFFSSF